MVRKVGWEDTTITGGSGGSDNERKYRGIKGERHVIRIMTDCVEYRIHAVDDVLAPDKDGEPNVFNMTCAKTWDDKKDDWVGECLGCDKDYDTKIKYIAGIIWVGTYKGRGRNVQKIDPENAAHFWPFGGDKYRKLSDLALELSQAEKKLIEVEIVVTCEDEKFQKLNFNLSQGERLTKKAHVVAYREEGPKLVEEASAGPSLTEQKRSLKKRKKKRGGDDDDSGSSSKKNKKDDETNDEVNDVGDEDLDDLLGDI